MSGFCQWFAHRARLSMLMLLGFAYLLVAGLLFSAADADGAMAIPDLRYHYDAQALHQILGAMGEAGRQRYVSTATTLDVLYPVVYSLFLAVALALLLDRVDGVNCLLLLAPFALLAADLMENGLVVYLAYLFPDRNPFLAGLAGWVTSAKWTLAGMVVGSVVLLTARAAFRMRRHRLPRIRKN